MIFGMASGAPVGDDLLPLGECWYWGQIKAKFESEGRKDYDDWKRQGWDPPCGGNNYTQWSERKDRHMTHAFFFIFVGMPAFIIFMALLFS